jgi:hypothetical protein
VGALEPGERVEGGVGGGVVALAGGAEQPRRRREREREVERQAAGEGAQVEGAEELGREDALEALPALLAEHAVVEHAGGVDEAGERRMDGGDDGGELGPIGDVGAGAGDGDAGGAPAVDGGASGGAGLAAAD